MNQTMDFDDEDATETEEESEHSHLADLSDGAGCTEIWEHLSESRED